MKKERKESSFIRHVSCENCGSSDGKAVYDDGHSFCFVCNTHSGESPTEASQEDNIATQYQDITPVFSVFRGIPRRGLSEDSIAKYGIGVNMDKSLDIAHIYPYYKNNIHVANKIRKRSEKSFYIEGEFKNIELFGQQLFPAGSAKAITLVEGEIDAASAYQMQGSKYPVVSVSSAGSAVRDVKNNYEYLNSFEKIVVCFDADEAKVTPDGRVFYPGQEAAAKVAGLFAPGKCAVMTLQLGKDASEYLQQGLEKEFVREWWKAPVTRPEGIKLGSEMWDEIDNRPSHFSVAYPWAGLQQMTYGMRLSEAVLLMADTGVGKTSIFSALELNLLMNDEVKERGYGVGLLHLEEPNFDTALHLMSTFAGKPYHLPDTEKTTEELRKVYDEVINNDRILFYDHFGSNDIGVVLEKIRHMAVMGCKYIFVDHLSIIVSDHTGDERKDLDEISTRLKMLTVELDIAVCCIIHTNRQGEARGSAGPEKVANIHISLERDKEDPDPIRRNITKITVKKNRFSGKTGPACWVYYDNTTHRLIELDDDASMKYEQNLPMTMDDLPWS